MAIPQVERFGLRPFLEFVKQVYQMQIVALGEIRQSDVGLAQIEIASQTM